MSGGVDLKAEQQATLARPPCRYSPAARFFFRAMDLFAGRRDTLPKLRLLEMLASIPYREWEACQYARLTRLHRNPAEVRQAREVAAWSRRAQDNEYWHLLVVAEKMREDGVREPWYLGPAVSWLAVLSYVALARVLARLSMRRAFEFNGEFEDHAEHVYAGLVADHPEWEGQRPGAELVKEYADLATWADVFRRIGLDERDHMNVSFGLAGRPECIAGGSRVRAGSDPAA
ncbi:MAG: hypothetical protein WAW06_08450 [bacterium]